MTDPAPRADARTAALLFAAGLAAYASLALAFPTVSPDGFIYLELARNLFHSGYVVLGEPHTKFLPFYPFLMALINLATAGLVSAEKSGQAVSVLCGASLAPVLFLLCRRLGASRTAALIAAAAQAIMAVGWDQYRDVNVMPIFTLLVFLAYWQMSADRAFPAGIAVGLAMITRYEGWLLLMVFIAASLPRPRALIKTVAGAAIAFSPWLIRNLLFYGSAGKTSYWLELGHTHLHLAEIALDMVKDFGPVVIIAAALGLGRLPRKWLFLLLAFAALYTGLHVVWWWYQDRFLLALMPAVFAPAALGLDRFMEWATRRTGRAKTYARTAAACVIAPIALVSALYLYGLAFLPQDPLLDAARSLRDSPSEYAVLGMNQLLLQHTADRPAVSWENIRPDDDPDAFVLDQVREHRVAYIVWLNLSPVDWQRFNFLKLARDRRATIATPRGPCLLTYTFIQSFSRGPRIALVYRVTAEPR
jgi:hypothetical protein